MQTSHFWSENEKRTLNNWSLYVSHIVCDIDINAEYTYNTLTYIYIYTYICMHMGHVYACIDKLNYIN